MAQNNPVVERMLDTEDATPFPWTEVYALVSEGDSAHTHWLATVRPNGQPHVVPVGVVGLEGKLYFTTGQGTRKGKNLELSPQCVITMSRESVDIVVEGQATKVNDEAKLQRVATTYAAQGWPAYVHDGVLDAPYSAPTTGPAPYDVYEMTPVTAFAFGTKEETVYRSSRYRF